MVLTSSQVRSRVDAPPPSSGIRHARRCLAAFAAAVLIAALGACGGESGDGDWGPLAVIPGDGGGAALTAARPGQLRIDDDCVFVDAGGGLKYTLVWPEGVTRWESARKVVIFTTKDGRDVELKTGDDVTFSGGYSGKPEVWVVEPSTSCPKRFFVVGGTVS